MDADDGSAGADQQSSLHRFLDMSIDLLGVLDLDTTILEASSSWERTLGWPPAEVVGRPLLEFFHEEDMPRVEAELHTLLAGGDAVAVTVRLRARDGSYRWVQGNARSDLAAARIYVTGADVTERMTLERALRAQVDLEELVASVASRLIGAEPDHVREEIERGVAALGQVMGADRGHFLRGRRQPDEATYVEWHSPDTDQREHTRPQDPGVQRWWLQVLEDQRLVRLDDVGDLAAEAPDVMQALRDDGVQSLLHVALPPVRGCWGFITMVAVRRPVRFSDAATGLLRLAGECFMAALAQRDDAVALLDARQELEHRNEQLERSNEELERFAYSAAHDLRAPLARIEMALSAATGSSPVPSVELLDIARRGAARMRQLIEDLLAFASVGQTSGGPVAVDLDELLTQALVDLDPAIAAQGVAVERGALPVVRGHPALLSQLLQNLLANAVKFARPEVPPVVRVQADCVVGGVLLTVADNGIGIDPAHRTEVFGVFTRLNPEEASPGSGIGLATCAKVVHHHGGRIWVDDGIDGGAAVHVWLPDEL